MKGRGKKGQTEGKSVENSADLKKQRKELESFNCIYSRQRQIALGV